MAFSALNLEDQKAFLDALSDPAKLAQLKASLSESVASGEANDFRKRGVVTTGWRPKKSATPYTRVSPGSNVMRGNHILARKQHATSDFIDIDVYVIFNQLKMPMESVRVQKNVSLGSFSKRLANACLLKFASDGEGKGRYKIKHIAQIRDSTQSVLLPLPKTPDSKESVVPVTLGPFEIVGTGPYEIVGTESLEEAQDACNAIREGTELDKAYELNLTKAAKRHSLE